MPRFVLLCLLLVGVPSIAQAGLHYSGEQMADLPSQWRGLLSDLRGLRSISIRPTAKLGPSQLRRQYQDEAARLREAAKTKKLTSDELADLGAVLLRLGETEQALQVLRAAQREHPQHYAIAANLGAAWHVFGDLRQAVEQLRHAVRLAPGKLQRAEEFHLKLVQLRQNQPRDAQELDDLFGVRYVGASGKFEPARLAPAERKKLPSDAVAIVQQLAVWLPNDARLIWQLAELANAHGDLKTAGDLFESCVGQFALTPLPLREHRLAVREALKAANAPNLAAAKSEHEAHAGLITFKSRRPLAGKRFDVSSLPALNKTGVNPVPWALFLETTVDRHFRPTFPKYLQELDQHQVSLVGFMQPLTDEIEMTSFMLIEYPTGCWYCEMPEIAGIVFVELPEEKTLTYSRSMVKITGTLSLNSTDPENFLYTIKSAKVSEAD